MFSTGMKFKAYPISLEVQKVFSRQNTSGKYWYQVSYLVLLQ